MDSGTILKQLVSAAGFLECAMSGDQSILRELFDAAVASADPGAALLRHLPDDTGRPLTVVGAGKASHAMAKALNSSWSGPVRGAVAVPYGHRIDAGDIEIMEASHPVPDENGMRAARKMLSLVAGLDRDDRVVALISGGGSALLPSPPNGMSLKDEIALNEALLGSGAPISAMNAIRKQFSAIKGGRLAAAAHPARVMTFVVSDVPGDDPAQVASGPTAADASDSRDALNLINRYRIRLPEKVLEHIRAGRDPAPSPDAGELRNCGCCVIASASMALEAAAVLARARGLNPVILSDAVEGESREAAKVLAAIAKDVSRFGRLVKPPAVILSGGETTVTMRGSGRGGRNTEFLLSLALEIDGWDQITALAADTDGIDGSGGHAGAFADGRTCARIQGTGNDPARLLGENNSFAAFEAAGSLLVTGPTGTNVNDFRAIIVR